MSQLLIGTDPEFFLWDTEQGHHVSAHDMIPGDKKAPHKVPHGAIQVDGTAVEFNIDPAASYEEFENNISAVLKHLRKEIPRRYSFDFSPAIEYLPKYFKTLPATTKELGCDPDFNVKTNAVNVIPKSIGTIRTGSGHIHLGWTKGEDVQPGGDHFEDCRVMVRQLDKDLDYYLMTITTAYDKDVQRRKYYGNTGAFRAKPYGVEYRTPSNMWLRSMKQWKMVYDITNTCYNTVLSGKASPSISSRITMKYCEPDTVMKLGL